MQKGNTFVPHGGNDISREVSYNKPLSSKMRDSMIIQLQEILIGTTYNIGTLDAISEILGYYTTNHPVNTGIRIPLSHIGDENIIKETLLKLKAHHTLGIDGGEEVIIVSKELISKLRKRIINITKSKVRVLLNEGICSDIVRTQINNMKKTLSQLGVTNKELINM